MNHYTELKERADHKGIKTFGDIAKSAGVAPEDIWGDHGWDPEMTNEYLYNCDGAIQGLEILAEEGEI